MEQLAEGTVDVAAFETATESKTLFSGSALLEALPDNDGDGLAVDATWHFRFGR